MKAVMIVGHGSRSLKSQEEFKKIIEVMKQKLAHTKVYGTNMELAEPLMEDTIDEIVKRYIAAFLEDTAKLNLKEEGMIRPKATENIGEMIKMIKELESKGYAYAVDGDVYFEVEKYEDYAALSHHNIEDLKSGARIDIDTRKKSPVDFALWKSAKEGEPFWNSPWGKGRPGWHIECSAMSKKYLGDSFDIHGGGQDLIFPHHENEIAQSKCSHGGEYGRYWMHNGYLNIRGEKMSKSSGNFFTLRDILKDYDGNMIRFFMLSSHYRKPIDFSDEELEMAKTAIERIENTILRAEEVLKETPTDVTENLQEISEFLETSKKKFEDGMDDDFNTAIAIGTVFEMVKEINRFIDLTQKSKEGLQVLRNSVEFIKQIVIDVLGIKLNLEMKVEGLSNELVELILDLRMNAKKDRNFALADDIRNRLSNLGIEIKDGKDKTAWTLKR